MKTVFETKTVNRKLINLEEVSIDVQATQKVVPFNHECMAHNKSSASLNAAAQYDRILNNAIEDLLVDMSNKTEPNIPTLENIFKIDKKKISYIAVLNLQIIQKLQYILERCIKMKAKVDIEMLKIQINTWRELVVSGLTETSEQQVKYGKLHEKDVENSKKTSENENGNDHVSEEPVKQKGVKKPEGRAMRSKGRNKNGGVSEVYDCVDS